MGSLYKPERRKAAEASGISFPCDILRATMHRRVLMHVESPALLGYVPQPDRPSFTKVIHSFVKVRDSSPAKPVVKRLSDHQYLLSKY